MRRHGAVGPDSSSRSRARVWWRRAAVAGGGSAATTAGSTGGSADAAGGATLKVGYSAWPGWFPLAVAEQEGIFEEAGVDVELTFFADYISSLDALVAGSIDVNTQTLNDTIFAVAAGSEQRIFVTNDNSTGNDAVICDASITSVADLAGKTIAAEPGVVDHFLLLQGLADRRHDRGRHRVLGLPTDAAAAAFAGGEFDCVGRLRPVHAPGARARGLARAVQLGRLPRRDLRPLRGHGRRRRPITRSSSRSSSMPGT